MGTYIKKLTAILLIMSVAAMLVLFSGCKKGGDEDKEPTDTAEGEKEPVECKVGFIYRGTVAGSTQNLIFESGRTQLEKNLGVETYFVENVFVTNFPDAVNLLIDGGINVIVSTSPAFSHVAETAAGNNSSVKFISFGNSSTRANLVNFKPLLYKPAKVCGLAAAYNSEAETLGIVFDKNMYNCYGVINAFIEGAKEIHKANFNAYVNNVESGNNDEVKRAIDDLVQKGNDTIMLYLETDYGIKYCEQIGVSVVAFAGNLPELAPKNYISGFTFSMNTYLTEEVRFIQNDSFVPSSTLGDLGTGLVEAIVNDKSLDGTKEAADILYEALTQKDDVFMGRLVDNHGTVMVKHGVTLTSDEVLDVNFMKWLDVSTTDKVKDFSEPKEGLDLVDLVVRGSAVDAQG